MSENKETQKETVESTSCRDKKRDATIESVDHSKTENHHEEPYSLLQRLSLVKIVLVSIISTLFLSSICLNFSYFIKEHSSDFSRTEYSHWILIFSLIIVTIVSLVTSFWTYYVRSVYLKDGPALVPEKWGSIIQRCHSSIQESFKKVQQSAEEQSRQSYMLLDGFLTLQKGWNERDDEIARLKKGYDAKIFKRFLLRFIRIDRSLHKMEQEFSGQENQKNYRYLKRIMQDALEECGVEKFTPDLRADYRNAGREIADSPKEVETENEEQDFQIAEVESDGYHIAEGEGDPDVIVPSRVSIFRFKPLEKEEE